MKIWVNGHEWSKHQARKTGLGFTELSNGFASAADPTVLQKTCDPKWMKACSWPPPA
jgi:hypothetical protein